MTALSSGWHLRTNPENADWVSKLLVGRPVRLSRAMLETLAIVAYRQPVTRPEVDDIRGVDCGPVLKTLLDRGLVRIIGKKEEVGRPMLYGTTPEFLRVFNLRDLSELPTLREFYDLSAEDQSRVEAEHGAPEAPPPGSATSPKPDVALTSVMRGALPPEPDDTDPLLDELDEASQLAKQGLGRASSRPRARAPKPKRATRANEPEARRASRVEETADETPPPRVNRKTTWPSSVSRNYLAQAGVASRRRAEDMIRAGEVTVGGAVVTELGISVDPQHDRVEVHGKRVRPEEPQYRVILKPRACLATLAKPLADTAESQRPLARFIPDVEIGWTVVAPLDFLAEGVVLLTTDGALAARMSRGGGHVPMTYHLKFQGKVGDEEVARLLRGWKWDGRPGASPPRSRPSPPPGKNTWVEMVVAESRPRVLKAAGDSPPHPAQDFARQAGRNQLRGPEDGRVSRCHEEGRSTRFFMTRVIATS